MNVGSRNSTGPVQATRKRISHNSQKSFGCSDAMVRERAPALDAFTIHGRDIPHHLPTPSPTTFANTTNCQQAPGGCSFILICSLYVNVFLPHRIELQKDK